MEPSVISYLLIALIALFASYVQSVTGFGFGIFAMIFLPYLLPYAGANALSSMLSTLTSLAVMVLMMRKVHWKNLIFPLIGFVPTSLGAVLFVRSGDNTLLTLLLGIALFLLSLYFFFFSGKIRIRPTWYAGLIAGLLSGILGGLFAISGPPVVIYFLQSEKDTDGYLATVSAYFVFSGVITVATKAAAGFVTPSVLLAFAIGLPAMLLGSFVGKKTRDIVKPTVIRRTVYAFMAISGLINTVSSALTLAGH